MDRTYYTEEEVLGFESPAPPQGQVEEEDVKGAAGER